MSGLVTFLLMVSLAGYSQTQVEVTATLETLGPTNYSTLKGAFDAINSGTHKGDIVIKINSSITETASATLNASGSGSASYTSINIYPTATGLSISGNLAAPLINLNGADKVTIDGRVNATGSTKSLTISNESTSNTTGTSTIQFINDASLNTVKYCTIKGASTDVSAGIVFFSTTTGSTGNDNNTVDHNDITNVSDANRPLNAVYAFGTDTKNNDGNTISNNNFFDFLSKATASNGINISSYNSSFAISGNSFFEAASFTPSSSATSYFVIRISAATGSGNGFTVSGNYIGGSAAQCGGSAWTKTAQSNSFTGISLTTATGTANSIQGNTIQNINWSNTGASGFTGISLSGVTVANIGTVTGNTIGAATATGSITFTSNTTNSSFYGINISSSDVVDCRNNTIGSITTSNTSTNSTHFYGIVKSQNGTATISNNTIGSTTTASSINASSTSSSYSQSVFGIQITSNASVTISGNTIANMVNAATGSSGAINGIYAGSGGQYTISNNTVRNLSNANANSSITGSPSVVGIIVVASASLHSQTVSGNSVFNLSNTNNSFSGGVIGIYYNGPTTASSLNGNFIHSLSVTGATSTSADLYGIKIDLGVATYSNNIVSLSGDTQTDIFGFFLHRTAQNNYLYFNTVYISGNPVSGATNTSYAMYSDVTATTRTRNYRNNIFVNTRSTFGGDKLHFAMYIAGTGDILTCDYNNYFVRGTGGVLGYFGANKTALPIVTGATGNDANSMATDPLFVNTAATASGYAPTVPAMGVTGTGITTDYPGSNRDATITTMGAIDGSSWIGGSTVWSTTTNWTQGTVPTASSVVLIPSGRMNYPVLTGNQTISSLALASGASLDLSSYNLTITSNLSNAGNIAGTGKLMMSGSTAQIISGTGTINNLEITNSGGVTITSGAENMQSLTGVLTPTAGTLNTNGNLTLKSSSTGTARIASHTNTGTISGNVTVERWINVASRAKQWRTMGFPFSGDMTMSRVSGIAVDYTLGTRSVMYYNEGNDDGRYGSGSGGRNAGYHSLINNADPIPAGQGVMIWLYGDGNTAPPANNGTMSGTLTMVSSGTLNESGNAVSLPVYHTAAKTFHGWNLVSNPYASAIDWNSASITKTRINNTIYRWNPASASWTTYNGTTGTPEGLNVDGIIESGGAFFVEASDDNPVLSIGQDAKVSSATTFTHFSRAPGRLELPQERARTAGTVKLAGIRLSVKGQGNPMAEEAYLDLSRQDATSGFDGPYDAVAMDRTSGAGIGLHDREEKSYAMQFDSPIDEAGVERRYYPIRVTSPAKGATTLELWTEGAWDPKNSVSLIDRKEGRTLLMQGGRLTYPFTMDELKSADRFQLAINHVKVDGAGAVPGFDVRLLGNPVRSEWIDLLLTHPSAQPKSWSVMDNPGRTVGTGGFGEGKTGNVQHRVTVPGMRQPGVYVLKVEMDNGDERSVQVVRN